MIGGHFDYDQHRIIDIAEEVERLIASNDDATPSRWGEPIGRGYSAETMAEFRAAIRHLRIAAIYAQRIDWLVSGDDSEGRFHRRLAADLAGMDGAPSMVD